MSDIVLLLSYCTDVLYLSSSLFHVKSFDDDEYNLSLFHVCFLEISIYLFVQHIHIFALAIILREECMVGEIMAKIARHDGVKLGTSL